MGDDLTPYVDGGAVDRAIKDAAKNAAREPGSPSASNRIQQAYYDRFLSRVFSRTDPTFVLKGGTGMLARIPQSRATRDIDLASREGNIDHAVNDLLDLVAIDLGDHFRFILVDRREQLTGENQPYTNGCRLTFDVYLGVGRKGSLSIDLAVGHAVTGPLEVRAPANRLTIPRLSTHDYVLYPIVDQIADKFCATIATYGDEARPSSREKDLVDLALIALNETVDAASLWFAIEVECRRRQLRVPTRFAVPGNWGRGYEKLAKPISLLSEYRSIDTAVALVARMLDPVLTAEAKSLTWDPADTVWRFAKAR